MSENEQNPNNENKNSQFGKILSITIVIVLLLASAFFIFINIENNTQNEVIQQQSQVQQPKGPTNFVAPNGNANNNQQKKFNF